MALMKCCARCQKIIPIGNTYCNDCNKLYIKTKREGYKYYNKNRRDKESQSFYNSKAWRTIATQIKLRDKCLCLVCLSKDKIKYKDVIHHIVPIKENKELSLTPKNLISLCDKCHKQIHLQYDKSDKLKHDMQDKLREIVNNSIFKR
ncbi:HNH endonuclease signature motif containing protein [Paraclostridium tenue]|uniref:Putative HNH nuclease YajD n=1 Tax=Paraclostridium tenue TaxID=1737 RepID=A0ABP3XHI8_9FIRM